MPRLTPGIYIFYLSRLESNTFWVEVIGIKTQSGSVLHVYFELFLGFMVCVYALNTNSISKLRRMPTNFPSSELTNSNFTRTIVSFIKSSPNQS